MADEHSHALSNTNQAKILAINEALSAENQRMAKLLRQMEQDRSKEEHKSTENKDNNDEHTSKTKHTNPKVTKMTTKKRTNSFVKEVMSFKMPQNFTLPSTLKPYNRIGDPNVHVTKFQAMMFMNKDSDPILCRTFPTFLDGAA
ncbi:uncharacterized protein DS421_3g96010 [Arachis hypogaea]|nr:uncharacterized protein DS421_3g96010 [Arachis hypogaea]